MKENFYAINRESAIAKAQEWAKTNNKFIVKLESFPEDSKNLYGWWICSIEIIEKPEDHILEGITLDFDNINAI
jgi:hypothetical protein